MPSHPNPTLTDWHRLKLGNGTQPLPRESMLRICFMQQWLNLSAPVMEVALSDSESGWRVIGI